LFAGILNFQASALLRWRYEKAAGLQGCAAFFTLCFAYATRRRAEPELWIQPFSRLASLALRKAKRGKPFASLALSKVKSEQN
jgi:hypothetical protein